MSAPSSLPDSRFAKVPMYQRDYQSAWDESRAWRTTAVDPK